MLVLEKTLESPLNFKENKPVSPKENQTWIFIGRIDAEAEASVLWPPDEKSWSFGKGLMQEKTEGGRQRGQKGISPTERLNLHLHHIVTKVAKGHKESEMT